jgi:hypothetical protein
MTAKTKFIAVVAVLLILAAVFPFIYGQSRMLSLKISEKTIVGFEVVEYEGEPFNSAILSRTAYTDQTILDSLAAALFNASISYIPGQSSPRMVFISFSDGTVLNGYVNEKRTGLDYGGVWLAFGIDDLTQNR